MSDRKLFSSQSFKRNLAIALGICLAAPLAGHAGSGPSTDRAEKMVLNLRVGQGSTGFYILESARYSREIEKDLRKALYQLRAVDAAYSKSRGRPDDKFLERAEIKLEQCQEKAKALTTEVEDASQVLRETITDTLVNATGQK